MSHILEIWVFKETTSLENDSTHPSRGKIAYQVNTTGSVQKLKNTQIFKPARITDREEDEGYGGQR